MDKVNSFNEVIMSLKDHESLSTNGNDLFYMKGDLITHKFNGNIYRLTFDDFIDLYKDTTFYYKESEQDVVDPKKDEEYYSRIQKKN